MPSPTLPTVLVLEREPQVLRVLVDILTRAGFTVLPARHSEGVLRLYEQHHSAVGLLVIDDLPPEIERLARGHPGLKVLRLSGFAEGQFANGLPVLSKPFTPAALVEAVRSTLSTPGALP